MKKKILSVFGTRPEAIKMVPLIKELEKSGMWQSLVCVTAQHREMLDQVLSIFDVRPDVDLNIMRPGQTLTEITTKTLVGLEKVFLDLQPDLVLVHGDTSTTFAASLAAFYGNIPIGHVEAGLRTGDKRQPFPEEINRRLTGNLADLHFAPTLGAKENLLKENVNPAGIFVTGNTAIDGLATTLNKGHVFAQPVLNHIGYEEHKVLAMTAHRRENLGQPLENICKGVLDIVNGNPDVIVVYAVHLSPAVQDTAHRILGGHPRIFLTPPLDIRDMHNLLNKSYLVLTDSGGLQEEVPAMGKPVLVLRNVTERPEGVAAGTLKLAGVERKAVYDMASALLHDKEAYQAMAIAKNPFGDGFASRRIHEAIAYYFGLSQTPPEDYGL